MAIRMIDRIENRVILAGAAFRGNQDKVPNVVELTKLPQLASSECLLSTYVHSDVEQPEIEERAGDEEREGLKVTVIYQ